MSSHKYYICYTVNARRFENQESWSETGYGIPKWIGNVKPEKAKSVIASQV